MEIISDFFSKLGQLEELIRWGGYTVLIIIVFAETGLLVGFFLPGDSLLVTAGLLAASGHLDIAWLNAFLIPAAIAGDTVGYWIGAKAGTRLYQREQSFLFRKDHLIWTQNFYDRHGGKTIILARFIPLARTFAPVVAGIGGMRYRRFIAYNVFGGMGWISSMTLLGWGLGRTIPDIDKHVHWVIAIVVFLSILPGLIEFLRQRRHSKPKPDAADKVQTTV
jgi:membrane-associated protein